MSFYCYTVRGSIPSGLFFKSLFLKGERPKSTETISCSFMVQKEIVLVFLKFCLNILLPFPHRLKIKSNKCGMDRKYNKKKKMTKENLTEY